jgi:hypothetical protein
MLVAVFIALAGARDARAQGSEASGPGRFEVSVGGLWIGHQPIGDTAANETTGTGSSLKIFTATTDLAAATGFEGRVAVRVLRSLEAEVDVSYAKPQLKVTVSNDFESAAPVTPFETIEQVTAGAGIVWYVPVGIAARLAPFASAGGGYLRQMHQGRTLLESGRYYQVGGGVKFLLFERPRGHVKALGARLDVRAVLRSKGIAFDTKAHAAPAIGFGVFTRF